MLKAKKEGKYKGRKPTALAKSDRVIDMVKEGYTREAIAKELEIGIASVYRILKNYKKMNPDKMLPGSRSNQKIATLEVWLEVENNSKYVRGKKKTIEAIELDWMIHYDMQVVRSGNCDYILKVTYTSDKDLEDKVYEIMSDAESTADYNNCFTEMGITHQETEKCW